MELIKLTLLNSFNTEHKVISIWKPGRGREITTSGYIAFNIWAVDNVIIDNTHKLKYAINKKTKF